MNFANPVWLYCTPAIVLLTIGLLLLGLRKRDRLLANFAASRLLNDLTARVSTKRTWIKALCIIASVLAICIALARPQYGIEWTERKSRGLDIVFVLDCSKSMLASDLRPNRLERAKLAILDLVERLESDRIGLIAFAGGAFLQTPPTLDYAAFRESLNAIEPTSMSRGGSDLGGALREANKAFPIDNNYKAVVLLTDGEDLGGNALKEAADVGKEGVKVFAIGIGTPEGDYLRQVNTSGTEEYMRDGNGQPIRTQLDESTLQEIAQMTGGVYARLNSNQVEALYQQVITTLPRSERESELQEMRIERFQILISIAAVLLLIELVIRRRAMPSVTLIFLAALFVTPIQSLPAQETNEPQTTNESTASEPVTTEDSIELTAEQRYNQAHASLTQGEYANALDQLDQAIRNSSDFNLQRDALYNQAHALFQTGEAAFQQQDFPAAVELWKEAEARFQSAHEIDAQDLQAQADADRVRARREALEDYLKQQQNQEQEQGQDQDQEGDEESEQQDEQQQDSGDEGDDGEGDQSQQENQDGEDSLEQQDGNEESDDSQQSESQDGSDQQPSQDSEQNDQGEADDTQNSEGTSPDESGEADDSQESMPLPDQTEESEAQPDEAAANSESSEDLPDPEEAQASQAAMLDSEAMEQAEAQALLDSLRGAVRLLPMAQPEQSQPNDPSKLRDW